jgi:hypothetical protein
LRELLQCLIHRKQQPDTALQQLDELSGKHIEGLRGLTKAIQVGSLPNSKYSGGQCMFSTSCHGPSHMAEHEQRLMPVMHCFVVLFCLPGTCVSSLPACCHQPLAACLSQALLPLSAALSACRMLASAETMMPSDLQFKNMTWHWSITYLVCISVVLAYVM